MKYWTCWDSKNIRMLWNLLVFLDDMKSGQCWHEWKRICHEPTVFFDLYETMVSVLNHEMKPLSIFLRMKPGRSIPTAAQVTVVSSLSTQSKQNWAPKSSQWFFCWRCPFLHENLFNDPQAPTRRTWSVWCSIARPNERNPWSRSRSKVAEPRRTWSWKIWIWRMSYVPSWLEDGPYYILNEWNYI